MPLIIITFEKSRCFKMSPSLGKKKPEFVSSSTEYASFFITFLPSRPKGNQHVGLQSEKNFFFYAPSFQLPRDLLTNLRKKFAQIFLKKLAYSVLALTNGVDFS